MDCICMSLRLVSKPNGPNHGDDARIRYTAAQVAGAGLGEEFVSHTRVG